MNRTLLLMLRTLPEETKSNWKDSLNKLIHAYNCTRHETTGFSPFFLMFGHSPRLLVDLLFDLGNDFQQGDYQDYVKTWQADMRRAYDLASRNTQKSSARSKVYYDKKASTAVLLPGDRVLVRNQKAYGLWRFSLKQRALKRFASRRPRWVGWYLKPDVWLLIASFHMTQPYSKI